MAGEDTGRQFETLTFGSESLYNDPVFGSSRNVLSRWDFIGMAKPPSSTPAAFCRLATR